MGTTINRLRACHDRHIEVIAAALCVKVSDFEPDAMVNSNRAALIVAVAVKDGRRLQR